MESTLLLDLLFLQIGVVVLIPRLLPNKRFEVISVKIMGSEKVSSLFL